MVKNKKIVLILIIILIILYFVISIFSFDKIYKNTVFIGNYTKVEVNSGDINVYYDNSKIKRQEVNYYFQKEIVDGYILSDNTGINNGLNEYYALNKDEQILSFENVLIGFTKDLSLKFKDIKKNISDDSDLAFKILENNNVSVTSNSVLDIIGISKVDYDDDGNEESIYSIGLYDDSNYYSFIFFLKDDKYAMITKNQSAFNEIEYTRLDFVSLIDFNNDDNYEFVISKVDGEYAPDYYELYNFDGIKFNKIGGE